MQLRKAFLTLLKLKVFLQSILWANFLSKHLFKKNVDGDSKSTGLKWKKNFKKFLLKRIHILEWLPNYTKDYALCDVIAGITISLTMIPQCIAYAALAELSPEYGLNSAFMGPLIYVFFGTIREVVIGPSSLMALLTLQYTQTLNGDFVVLLSFLCGIVELILALLRLDFLVEFISVPVVSGFTTATSLIIFFSQVKGIFGIKYASHQFVETIKMLWVKFSEMQGADFILGICTFVGLLIFRKFQDIRVNKEFKWKREAEKSLWLLAIARNALAVLTGAFITYSFEKDGSVAPYITTGHVQQGIPPFRFPPTSTTVGNRTFTFPEMVYELGSGIVLIPIISILANIAIAKAFSTGRIDATQEMITLALANIFGSFFRSMPSTGAFTRSAVISASGVQTPLANLYAALLTLFSLQFLTPFFHFIPRCVLSAVLMVAVLFMIDWRIYKPLWKTSKLDLFVVVLTTVACLLFGVVLGLLAGITVGIGYLIYLWARPLIAVEIIKEEGVSFIKLTPNKGLYFPAVDYLRSVAMSTAVRNQTLPVIIDCRNFTGVDYSVALGGKECRRRYTILDKITLAQWIAENPLNCDEKEKELEEEANKRKSNSYTGSSDKEETKVMISVEK